MTYMLLLNCPLKLVEEIILYYDARSKKHQINNFYCCKGKIYYNKVYNNKNRVINFSFIFYKIYLFL